MKWHKLRTLTHRTHFVSEELISGLVHDLLSRGGKETTVTEISEVSVDLGGIGIEWPEETVDIDGLRVKLRCHDIFSLSTLLGKLPRRDFGGVPYFKLKTPFNCLVLSEHQHEQLKSITMALRDEAENTANIYAQLRGSKHGSKS